MKHGVYLAGPITGCTYDECVGWRKDFSRLMPPSIECYSPMRGKHPLKEKGVIEGSYPDNLFTNEVGIMKRDFWDCTRAAVILVNLKDTPKVSIGTVMELAWAYQAGIPVVAVLAEDDDIHGTHPMIRQAIAFRVTDLQQAADAVHTLLALEDK